jgi:hypothetical protein
MGTELHASFREGSFKKPKLSFVAFNTGKTSEDYNEQGERRGDWKIVGSITEHYIFLPEERKARRKFLENIIAKSPGTQPMFLTSAGTLSYRDPTPDNSHTGTHGGSFSWDQFCDLTTEQLAQLQHKRYYKDDRGALLDKDNIRVEYDASTGNLEKTDLR